MNLGFWEKLKKPFFVLAPLADVTDTAFRELIAKYSKYGGKEGGFTHPQAEIVGGPDVFWTEFVSVDGLLSAGREVLLKDLEYTEREHPIVAQIFGSRPDNFREVGKLIKKLDFDGIDINMGCPDKSVEKQGAGANLIKNPKLAQEIIRATMEGAPDLPVSIKTRIGYHNDNLDEWLRALLETRPAAITIHARTRKEMSNVPARWEEVARAVKLARGTGTLIIGNGDVADLKDAQAKAYETGADGIMLGRAIFGNPWLFNRKIKYSEIPINEKLKVMVEHTKLFEKKLGLNQPGLVGRTDLQSKSVLGDIKSFAVMKKHYKSYVNGFDGAKELRMELMGAQNAKEVEDVVNRFLGV
ncbi:MAG: tRNA-dihydrouridine synthase [Patescibacteria group bacterium]